VELFKNILPAIFFNKKEVFDDPEAEKVYNPFMVNRALSYHSDIIFAANEMNQNWDILDKSLQISYFLNTVRARKRPFVRWSKPIKEGDLEAIKQYYGYSTSRALEIMKLLSAEQITLIKERIKQGE